MTAALPRDGASIFQNPASLSRPSTGKFEFLWSLIWAEPQVTEISSVLVENSTNSDRNYTGNVDTDYPTVIGQAIGLNYQWTKSPIKPAFGFLTYLPIDRFAQLDSGEPFQPDYVLMRSRLQKPEFHFGGSIQPSNEFRVGAGVQLGATLNSKTSVFLQSNSNTANSSSMRISASMKTKASPYFGVQWEPTRTYLTGLNVRLPLSNPETFQVRASARTIGNVAALDFNYSALATAYYEPLSVEWGNRLELTPDVVVLGQVDYQAWSRFEAPQLEIEPPSTTQCAPNCGVQFAPTRYPSFTARDAFIPRVGMEIRAFRMGYAYERSIFKNDDSSNANNMVDPNKHRFSAGYRFMGTSFLETDLPWTIDFHALWTYLERQTIRRAAGELGSPGFEVGGNLFGAGLSLNLSL